MSQEQLIDLSDFPESNYESIYDIEEQNKRDFIRFIEEQIMKKVDERFSELNNKILEQQLIIDKLTNENSLLEKKMNKYLEKSQVQRNNIVKYGFYNGKEIYTSSNDDSLCIKLNFSNRQMDVDTFTNSLNNKICLYDSIFVLSSYDHIVLNCVFNTYENNKETHDYYYGNNELLFIKTINLKIRYIQEYRNITFFNEPEHTANIKNGYIIVSLNLIQLMSLLNIRKIRFERNYIYDSLIHNHQISVNKSDVNIDDIDKSIIEKETNKEAFIKLKNCLTECGYIN